MMAEITAPAPANSLHRLSLMDILVIGGSLLGVLTPMLLAYNSYNDKFTDINRQIYELKVEFNKQDANLMSDIKLLNSRTTFNDNSITNIINKQDAANNDTRDRLDKLKDSVNEIHNEIIKANNGRR